MKYIIILIFSSNSLLASDSIPVRLYDTIIILSKYSKKYDTLLTIYDTLGREIETSHLSAINGDYNNSWFKYTTYYDSIGRDIGGVIYGIDPPNDVPYFYLSDTLWGKLDTTIVESIYNGDTIFTSYDYLKYKDSWKNTKSISYKVKNNNGQLIEETEFNDINEYKKRKLIYRDSLNQTKVEVTKHYKKTGYLKHTEIDSIYYDSSFVKRIVKSTSRKNAKASKFDCENCTIYYTHDSSGNITRITKHNTEGDTLVLHDLGYNEEGKIISSIKREYPGDIEKTTWQYNKYGHIIDSKQYENNDLSHHWKYKIRYKEYELH